MGMGSGYNRNPYSPFGQSILRRAAPPPPEPSMIADMIARANLASQNVNVPSLAQLFPMLQSPMAQAPQMQAPMQNNMSSGAGRFLGQSPMMTSSAPSIPFNFNAPTT